MKNLLFYLLILSSKSTLLGKDHDKLIIPITVDLLQDEYIRKDVSSILNGNISGSVNLHEYKTKGNDSLVVTNYKNNCWRFYLGFSEKVFPTKTKNEFDIYCPSEKELVDDLRFFHVKYMLKFTPHSLSDINKQIVTEFGGQSVTILVKSYISKVNWHNYLHLSIEKGNKKLDYVFIIQNPEFHECVVSRTY